METVGVGRRALGNDQSALPLKHSGNSGIYAVADQTVWRGKEQSLSIFLRGDLATSDRNLVSFYVDGGAALKGPFTDRPDDVLSFAIAYAKISPNAAAADRDASAVVRDYETVLELDYSAQIAPGGRCSRTSSTSSIPMADRTRTILLNGSETPS